MHHLLLCSNGLMTTVSQWRWRSPTYRTTSSPVTFLMRWYCCCSFACMEICREIRICVMAGWFFPQMLLVDYYRAAPDIVQFNQFWCPDTTMMDKIKVGGSIKDLKLWNRHAGSSDIILPPSKLFVFCHQGSLSCHAPKDQAYSQILEHVYSQLCNMQWADLFCLFACSRSPSKVDTFHKPLVAQGWDHSIKHKNMWMPCGLSC